MSKDSSFPRLREGRPGVPSLQSLVERSKRMSASQGENHTQFTGNPEDYPVNKQAMDEIGFALARLMIGKKTA
jgi:hypothetical protein